MGFASEANIHTLFSLKSTTEAGLVALKRENEQLRVAANELGHCLKNLVAVTQSIVRQTIRQSSTMEDFEARFSGRLGAFGRSAARSIGLALHELATNSGLRCSGAPFTEICTPSSKPKVASSKRTSASRSALCHLLAAKYGALSVPEGNIAVHWKLASRGGRRRLLMTWKESGGPMVTAPTRWGFGRQIIQQIPAQALTGDVTHQFLPHGVGWALDIPATFVHSEQVCKREPMHWLQAK
jgi:two-component sensor histidine kinase